MNNRPVVTGDTLHGGTSLILTFLESMKGEACLGGGMRSQEGLRGQVLRVRINLHTPACLRDRALSLYKLLGRCWYGPDVLRMDHH